MAKSAISSLRFKSKSLLNSFTKQQKPREEPFATIDKDQLDLFGLLEYRKLCQTYTIVKQLGVGGHSSVMLARHLNGKLYATKVIQAQNVWHWDAKLPMEITVMKNLANNDSFVHICDNFVMSDYHVIVMEYLGADWIDLYDYIETFSPLSEVTSLGIFTKVLDGVLFMHSQGICHNDIKGNYD